jgi:hypothetical protein
VTIPTLQAFLSALSIEHSHISTQDTFPVYTCLKIKHLSSGSPHYVGT